MRHIHPPETQAGHEKLACTSIVNTRFEKVEQSQRRHDMFQSAGLGVEAQTLRELLSAQSFGLIPMTDDAIAPAVSTGSTKERQWTKSSLSFVCGLMQITSIRSCAETIGTPPSTYILWAVDTISSAYDQNVLMSFLKRTMQSLNGASSPQPSQLAPKFRGDMEFTGHYILYL
jgi:hypothetical protein